LGSKNYVSNLEPQTYKPKKKNSVLAQEFSNLTENLCRNFWCNKFSKQLGIFLFMIKIQVYHKLKQFG